MPKNSMTSVYYRVCVWVARMLALHLLWLLGVAAGLVIFGLAPATAALFAVLRRWQLDKDVSSMFALYWHYYRADWLRANMLVWGYALCVYVLYHNLYYYGQQEHMAGQLLWLVTVIMLVVSAALLMFLFPVMSHYQLSGWGILRTAAVIGVACPLHVLVMGAGLFVLATLYSWFPGLLIAFGISLPAWWLMTVARHAFQYVERLRQQNSRWRDVRIGRSVKDEERGEGACRKS